MITIVPKQTTPYYVYIGKGSPLENKCRDRAEYGDWLLHAIENNERAVMAVITRIIRMYQGGHHVELVIGNTDDHTHGVFIKNLIGLFMLKSRGLIDMKLAIASIYGL